MKIILYDDYNSRFALPYIIGTIRQTFGAWAFTNGWKIIEIYETEDNTDRHDMEERGQRLGLP